MNNELSISDVSIIESDEELTTVTGGGKNEAGAHAGISVGGARGVNATAGVKEIKTDFRACLDGIGKYNGKVGECEFALEKKK